MSKCMAVNCGSSSIKYKLFEMPEEKAICSGLVDRVGHEDATFKIKFGSESHVETLPILDHSKGVELILNALVQYKIVEKLEEIDAVGHRVAQGGKYFKKSAYMTPDTIAKIEALVPLAPLHNPAHLLGYNAFKKALPNATAIAVFDSAFHSTMEEEDYTYPIPYELTEKYDCRRYGAHGTSHQYLSEVAIEKYLHGKKDSKIIVCHLGSGASLCAVRDGKSIATTMGMTPLAGIMMGTRCGDIDPSVVTFLQEKEGLSAGEINSLLNKKSGFLGVSGVSNDTRDVEKAASEGNHRAILAQNLFGRRAADFIGQYFVRLGGADMIVFSGGIGENSAAYRKLVLDRIGEALGVVVDEEANKGIYGGKEGVISAPSSKILVAVIPTDEEVMIARDCLKALKGTL